MGVGVCVWEWGGGAGRGGGGVRVWSAEAVGGLATITDCHPSGHP